MMELQGSRFYNTDAVAGAREYLADDSVDLIVTDPPYGIDGDRLHRHYNRDERFVIDGYLEIPAARYNGFSHAWMQQAQRVLRPGGSLYVVSGYTNLYDVLDALRATQLREVNHLIWKYPFGVYTSRKYVSSHYHILYYEKPGGRRTFNLQARFGAAEFTDEGGSANYRDREDVFVIGREYKPGREKNKNELPRALLVKLLQYSSNENDLVCDFFMGSCSTARVAMGMNRRFVGFEASRTAFAHHVPKLAKIVPGELLPALRTPPRATRAPENARKTWTDIERKALEIRYRALCTTGVSKGAIVQTLSAEFKRGSWAITKLLKKLDPNRSR